jgi:hypothetical protein
MYTEQDDEMLVSMASAHGAPGADVNVAPEQLASDMELLHQVGGPAPEAQSANNLCLHQR